MNGKLWTWSSSVEGGLRYICASHFDIKLDCFY